MILNTTDYYQTIAQGNVWHNKKRRICVTKSILCKKNVLLCGNTCCSDIVHACRNCTVIASIQSDLHITCVV